MISRTTLTPDADGWLTKMESVIWETDGNLIIHGVKESGKPAQYTDSSGNTWTENRMPARDFDTNLLDWLDAQLNIIPSFTEQGFAYAGHGTLLGRPSVRYERPLTVVEFVKNNPTLVRESRYTRTKDANSNLNISLQRPDSPSGNRQKTP